MTVREPREDATLRGSVLQSAEVTLLSRGLRVTPSHYAPQSISATEEAPPMLQVDVLPMRALRLSGTLNAMDVEPLIEAIRNRPTDGAIALHQESLTDISHDAAQLLRQRLDTIWIGQPMYLHVVSGDVAEILETVGFTERDGGHELVYNAPRTG